MTHEDELRVREIIAEGNSGCVEVLFVFLVMVALVWCISSALSFTILSINRLNKATHLNSCEITWSQVVCEEPKR